MSDHVRLIPNPEKPKPGDPSFHEYYEMLDQEHLIPQTITANLRNIKRDDRGDFCMVPKMEVFGKSSLGLINRLLCKEPVTKTQLAKETGLPHRVVQYLLGSTQGMIVSVETNQTAARDKTARMLDAAMFHYLLAEAQGDIEELHGRKKKIERLHAQLERQERCLLAPKIFVGQKYFRKQGQERDWKEQYTRARYRKIGAVGSKDESTGNSTFPITFVTDDRDVRRSIFHVSHEKEVIATFSLPIRSKQAIALKSMLEVNRRPFGFVPSVDRQGNEVKKLVEGKEQTILRKDSTGRVALTITLWQDPEEGQWMIRISYFEPPQPLLVPLGELGVDLNTDSLAPSVITWDQGLPCLGTMKKLRFPKENDVNKIARIYEIIGQITEHAKEHRLQMVLEKLDFEHCKPFLNNKLGALLHILPYAKIRNIFVRKCAQLGVPLKFINPQYTSLLGGVLTTFTGQGRDAGASAIIALRGSDAGNQWLESTSKQLLECKQFRIRLNAKGKFGKEIGLSLEQTGTVTVLGAEPRMVGNTQPKMTAKDRLRSAQKHRWYGYQVQLGRVISAVAKQWSNEFWSAQRAFGKREAILRLKNFGYVSADLRQPVTGDNRCHQQAHALRMSVAPTVLHRLSAVSLDSAQL